MIDIMPMFKYLQRSYNEMKIRSFLYDNKCFYASGLSSTVESRQGYIAGCDIYLNIMDTVKFCDEVDYSSYSNYPLALMRYSGDGMKLKNINKNRHQFYFRCAYFNQNNGYMSYCDVSEGDNGTRYYNGENGTKFRMFHALEYIHDTYDFHFIMHCNMKLNSDTNEAYAL